MEFYRSPRKTEWGIPLEFGSGLSALAKPGIRESWGLQGLRTGPMVVSQGRGPSSITLGETWGTCVEVSWARTILLTDDHRGVTGELEELTKDHRHPSRRALLSS